MGFEDSNVVFCKRGRGTEMEQRVVSRGGIVKWRRVGMVDWGRVDMVEWGRVGMVGRDEWGGHAGLSGVG